MEVAKIDHSVRIIDVLLREFLPELRNHFAASNIRMDMFLIDWYATKVFVAPHYYYWTDASCFY